MSRLTRWQAIFLATAIVIVPILSCSQRSLVLVTVNASAMTDYTDVSLVITAIGQETTTFSKVSFTNETYKVGVYLPSDMSGPVSFTAEVVKDGCQIATGGPVMSPDVSSGATVSMAIDVTANVGPCVPADGGAGSSGTGSGGSGTGGASGRGGSGTGGVVGTGRRDSAAAASSAAVAWSGPAAWWAAAAPADAVDPGRAAWSGRAA